MRRVQIVYFDAGGGHRSAAGALAEAIRRYAWPWDVETVNLDGLLEPVDLVQKATGRRGPEWYNWSLRQGWTSAPTRLMPAVRGYLRAMRPHHVRLLREHWRASAPDLVVSVLPHYNRALFDSLRDELADTPMVTILTDLADCPPHFWFELQDQHFICGSARSVEQARALGIREDRLWRVSGMIVHPRFYGEGSANRAGERLRLGLAPAVTTVMVMFGGCGSTQMLRIARSLAAARARVQLVLLCGNNGALMEALRRLELPFGTHIEGFTAEVDRFMRLSDIFVGKPGPGSVSEAFAAGLPVVVERNSRTMPQERHTIHWVLETATGMVLPSFDEIAPALELMQRPDIYAGYRSRVLAVRNQAVFEIPAILDRIMSQEVSGRFACGAVAI